MRTVEQNNVYLHVVQITQILFGLFRSSDNRETSSLVRMRQSYGYWRIATPEHNGLWESDMGIGGLTNHNTLDVTKSL